ncbi:uncharacterized protein LOC123258729 [Cotesia glomerata]|uniref:uncharacterized protein LOC123258729 n=1 Tax=Cotesia glomerata TaxID=32391 RepID=UPI001D02AE49|nr:uncharacterized protein LOC123258729 [Cotesia glomerata]
MSRECKYCSNVIVTDYVKCPVCDSAYYPGCVKQTKVSPNGGYQKCCCRKNSFTLSDFRSLIKEKNVALSIAIKKDFSYQLKTVVTSVESLTVTVNKNNALLNDRISAVETVNKTLETNLAILETKVANNAECVSSLINHMGIAGCSSNAAVLEEVEERLTRRGNILIFGVSESKEASKETREAHDRSLVVKICSDLKVDFSLSTHFRIGKYSPALAKPRPIKLSFTNAGMTDLIIQNLVKLKRSKQVPPELQSIAISKDRTLMQRNQQKEAWAELRRRIQEGETDLKMVTRNGLSSIVKAQVRRSRQIESVSQS